MQIGKIKEEEMGVNLEEKAKQFETKGKKIYSRYFFYSVYLFIYLFVCLLDIRKIAITCKKGALVSSVFNVLTQSHMTATQVTCLPSYDQDGLEALLFYITGCHF